MNGQVDSRKWAKTPIESVTKTRVFISHSAQPDEAAKDMRTRLADALKCRGFDVLLDERRVNAGDEWRPLLYRWLGVCEVAIILFNKAVIERPEWVRFEVHALKLRAATGDPVRIIPVLLPGVTHDDIAAIGLGPDGPVRIVDHQFAINADGTEQDHLALLAKTLDGIADVDVARSAVSAQVSPRMLRWINDIEQYLPDDPWLHDAELELGITAQTAPKDLDARKELVAYTLLFTDLDCIFRAVGHLMRGKAFRGDLKHAINLLLPSWVAPKDVVPIAAACEIVVEAADQEPATEDTAGNEEVDALRAQVVLLKVIDDATMSDYVRRTVCCDPTHAPIKGFSPDLVGESTDQAIKGWLETALANKLCRRGPRGPDNVRMAIKKRAEDGTFVFVLLGSQVLALTEKSGTTMTTLSDLAAQFPGTIFIANPGDTALLPATARLVHHRCPDLSPERESEVETSISKLLGLVP